MKMEKMNRKIMAIITIAIIGIISVLGVTASMDNSTDEYTEEEGNKPDEQIPPESPLSEPHQETGKVEHIFKGTVDGPDDPEHGTCACENDHYKINNSVTKIVAIFRWEDTYWDLDVAIGIGGNLCTGEAV